MYALYVYLIHVPYMYALCVCLIHMPYMHALHLWLIAWDSSFTLRQEPLCLVLHLSNEALQFSLNMTCLYQIYRMCSLTIECVLLL